MTLKHFKPHKEKTRKQARLQTFTKCLCPCLEDSGMDSWPRPPLAGSLTSVPISPVKWERQHSYGIGAGRFKHTHTHTHTHTLKAKGSTHCSGCPVVSSLLLIPNFSSFPSPVQGADWISCPIVTSPSMSPRAHHTPFSASTAASSRQAGTSGWSVTSWGPHQAPSVPNVSFLAPITTGTLTCSLVGYLWHENNPTHEESLLRTACGPTQTHSSCLLNT